MPFDGTSLNIASSGIVEAMHAENSVNAVYFLADSIGTQDVGGREPFAHSLMFQPRGGYAGWYRASSYNSGSDVMFWGPLGSPTNLTASSLISPYDPIGATRGTYFTNAVESRCIGAGNVLSFGAMTAGQQLCRVFANTHPHLLQMNSNSAPWVLDALDVSFLYWDAALAFEGQLAPVLQPAFRRGSGGYTFPAVHTPAGAGVLARILAQIPSTTAVDATGAPEFMLQNPTGAANTANNGRALLSNGCLFRSATRNRGMIPFHIGISGWRWDDFADTGHMTNDLWGQFAALTLPPSAFVFSLGANQTSTQQSELDAGVTTAFKGAAKACIERFWGIWGRKPVLLITPPPFNKTTTNVQAMADAYAELCTEMAGVSMIHKGRLVGAGTGAVGPGASNYAAANNVYSSGSLRMTSSASDWHPVYMGSMLYAARVWQEFERASGGDNAGGRIVRVGRV